MVRELPRIMIKGQTFVLDIRTKEIRNEVNALQSYPLIDCILELTDEISGKDIVDIYADELLNPKNFMMNVN